MIMAFADSYLDIREYSSGHVNPPANAQALTLEELSSRVNSKHPGTSVNRIGLDRDPHLAYEFYYDKTGLDYVDPYSGELRTSDSVPLRRKLHKGVEQWHRFFGLSGEHGKTGKLFASWFNVALIPLLLTGLVLWWPRSLRWHVIRTGFTPAGASRGRGTERSWHTATGFWALPFLLIMVVTATTHSFDWVRDTVHRIAGPGTPKPGSTDSLWAPGLPRQPIPANATLLTLDELRDVSDRELPGWTHLNLIPASKPKPGNKSDSTRLVAHVPGWGPAFFPVVVQVDPYSGEVLDIHSWEDLSPGTRLLAWSRWLHKGDAFGRTGQVVAGIACILMLVLIYTGWALAIRRLARTLKGLRSSGAPVV